MNNKIKLLFAFFSFTVSIFAQDNVSGGAYPMQRADSQNPCVTAEQYKNMEEEMEQNCKKLNIQIPQKKGNAVTSFSWPLKAASGFTGCGYYLISNYVDQDMTTGIKDYNCGAVTYDGHKGMDIASFPYSFYKMDHDQVEIIAAAAGTIITKVNGNFDKNCAMNNLTPNYIVILHADGSRAFYLHMKINSQTSKVVGQTVTTGEFLGLVGSSGSSTGPHLHFEVWNNSNANSVIDPYTGTCNGLNTTTWWTAQKPYTEPAVLSVQVNTQIAQFPACPGTEVPNDLNCLPPAANSYFYIFLRNETSGLPKNMKILGPGTAVYSTWSAPSNNSYLGSYWYWNFNAPSVQGTYTFVATYNGTSCSKVFQVGCTSVGLSANDAPLIDLKVISKEREIVLNYEGLENATTRVTLTNISGQIILQETFIQNSASYTKSISSAQFVNGVYFLTSETLRGLVSKKIIVQHD